MIIAGAGGAAHLPGMVAARTVVPVLGVPISATALQGFDSLLSIVQMPKGVPVGTLAIGAAGATNAGLLAVQILATTDAELRAKLVAWRAARRDEVLAQTIRRWGLCVSNGAYPPILPGATIGIFGGGQLGRLTAMAARGMGYRILVLDPDPACPARFVVDGCIEAGWDDSARSGKSGPRLRCRHPRDRADLAPPAWRRLPHLLQSDPAGRSSQSFRTASSRRTGCGETAFPSATIARCAHSMNSAKR